MKEEVKKVYTCDHCNKRYFRKNAALKHEAICYSNPANIRACHKCKHLTKSKFTNFIDTFHGEQKIELELFFCSKRQIPVYPPQVEIKGNAFGDLYKDGEEFENKPMPKECKDLKEMSYLKC